MFLYTHPLEWFPRFKQRVYGWLYQFLARYDYEDWTFTNYGYADELPDGIEADTDALVDLLAEIQQAEEKGVEFSDDEVPDPETALNV